MTQAATAAVQNQGSQAWRGTTSSTRRSAWVAVTRCRQVKLFPDPAYTRATASRRSANDVVGLKQARLAANAGCAATCSILR